MNIYAVIHTGGKQYRVSPGDVVRVEKLSAQPGEKIEIDRVYLMAHDGGIFAGNPVLKSTRVVAQVLDQDRGKKIIIFKHRRRKGYRKTIGHRQAFTELKILEIIHEGASYHEQPEKQKQLQKPSAAAPAVKKAESAKQQTVAKKKPEKQAVAPPPREPEKPKPAEQRIDPEVAPVVPAAGPEITPIAEPVVPAAPLPEPERSLSPAKPLPLVEARPLPIGREGPSTKRRLPWWIIGAIIAALTLLGLLLFNGRNRPLPGPETRQETVGKPAQEKQDKAKPLVRDVKIKKTAPVDKPAAPAQPPD